MYRLIKKRIPPLFRVGVICCEKVFELSIRQPRRAKGELSMALCPCPMLCQSVAQLGAFWQNAGKTLSLPWQKEEGCGPFLFSRFWGELSYMGGKNYLIGS